MMIQIIQTLCYTATTSSDVYSDYITSPHLPTFSHCAMVCCNLTSEYTSTSYHSETRQKSNLFRPNKMGEMSQSTTQSGMIFSSRRFDPTIGSPVPLPPFHTPFHTLLTGLVNGEGFELTNVK